MANMVPTGKSPVSAGSAAMAYGFNVATYPVACMTVACEAIKAI